MLEEFGPSLYLADGPTVLFYGFPYPTRMAVARLSDGSAWIWSPIALTDELAGAVEEIGPVRYVVSPNKIHHLFLAEWAERWPEARVYAPPGLARRKPEIQFDADLGDEPDAAWADDIDQVVFRGSFAMEEVVFFHAASRTLIVADLCEHFGPWSPGLTRLVARAANMYAKPRMPPDWQLSFRNREATRATFGWASKNSATF